MEEEKILQRRPSPPSRRRASSATPVLKYEYGRGLVCQVDSQSISGREGMKGSKSRGIAQDSRLHQ